MYHWRGNSNSDEKGMRLGGNVFYQGTDPVEYALAHVKKGFGAALCPDWISLEDRVKLEEFKAVMKEYEVRIAEVGAWCNPMHPDRREAEANIQYMIGRLRLAQELEAATCVNILGTKQTGYWCGPHKDCYSENFFEEAGSPPPPLHHGILFNLLKKNQNYYVLCDQRTKYY